MTAPELHLAQVAAHRQWAADFTDWLRSEGVSRPGPNPEWLAA